MVPFGQHPEPRHTIVHLSDTHLIAAGRPLYGRLDTEGTLERMLAQIVRSGIRPDAVVLTGDLTDSGEPDAYRRLRRLVDAAASTLGARVIWVMGNHDERASVERTLLDRDPTDEPLDAVHDVGGLRIIVLDSTVPGYHHGEITESQLAWLRSVLAERAPHGSLLALHHPPIPTPVGLMGVLELENQERLADALRGTDVRAILAGHLHHSAHSTFAGIPVSVAGATCYTIDLTRSVGALGGVDAGQSASVVQVYDDVIVHSTVPLTDGPTVAGFDVAYVDRLRAMPEEARRDEFSRKRPPIPSHPARPDQPA